MECVAEWSESKVCPAKDEDSVEAAEEAAQNAHGSSLQPYHDGNFIPNKIPHPPTPHLDFVMTPCDIRYS